MSITNEYKPSVSITGLPSTSEVIDLCRQNGYHNKGLIYRRNGIPIAYIKYGTSEGVPEGEMPTQLYVYRVFKQMDVPPVKIPEIYHAFERFETHVGKVTYIIMEYLHGQTVETAMKNSPSQIRNDIFNRVAKIVDQLMNIPSPSHLHLGPVQRGKIHHSIFTDDGAAENYRSVNHLQRHFNKVLEKVKSNKKVDFSHDSISFCYHDIEARNFLITNNNDMCVIDFEHAAFLPESFMSYTLHAPKGPFVREIASRLSVRPSSNLEAMGLVRYHFAVRDSSSFGLPCD